MQAVRSKVTTVSQPDALQLNQKHFVKYSGNAEKVVDMTQIKAKKYDSDVLVIFKDIAKIFKNI